MENRGGYAYGIWILLTPTQHMPIRIKHKLHITLMSGITCRRKAVQIYSQILKENFDIPFLFDIKDSENMKIVGGPLNASGLKVNIHNWDCITKKLLSIYPGNIPEIPHISIEYHFSKDINRFQIIDKNMTFITSVVLVDMNDSSPINWHVV